MKRSESVLEIKGIISHWYFGQSDNKKGWIWGGNIAQRAFGSYGDAAVKFLGGRAKIEKDVRSTYQIIALKNMENDRFNSNKMFRLGIWECHQPWSDWTSCGRYHST